jgi:hypothetical protein
VKLALLGVDYNPLLCSESMFLCTNVWLIISLLSSDLCVARMVVRLSPLR